MNLSNRTLLTLFKALYVYERDEIQWEPTSKSNEKLREKNIKNAISAKNELYKKAKIDFQKSQNTQKSAKKQGVFRAPKQVKNDKMENF